MELFNGPWPWYIGGPLIGLMVPLLLYVGNKQLGVSSSLRHFCAACIPAKIPFFDYNWKDYVWNLVFVLGIGLGGYLTLLIGPNDYAIGISEATISDLRLLGISDFSGMVPDQIFNISMMSNSSGWFFMVFGGILIGFGTRYADGCTSGHTIMGLSNLQLSSLVATIGFFIGGLAMTHIILPLIF
ncbi:MAG: YeeE/YedE thiosulfate transporter family protein [Bacteroidetes bacterium]|nr:YeeE/YedE thiosulfate transporter family protein [Bacteroidota bacterium]MDA1121393.1 YeeE/YedE thiosulfate transporter family protein [Bacteroidota bacterium]